MPTIEDCIFCKIVSGEIPKEKSYQDDKVIAFLDLKPKTKGHTLVIHKAHTPDFIGTSDEILAELMPRIKTIAEKILKEYNATGFNLTVNNGASAGQVISHLHFHIIPRT